MYTARPLDGRPQKEVQVGPDKLEVVASFRYLGDMLSAAGGCELSTTTHVKTAWKKFKDLLPVLSSRHLSFNIHVTWPCVQLLCAEHNAPCQQDLAIDKAKSPASAAKWQGNDQTDLQCQTAHHQVQWATCAALHWGSGPHSEGERTPMVWTCGTLQSRQPLTYRLMESMGLGGPRWHGNSWQRDCREWKLSVINPHDRPTWRSGVRSAMHAASQLSGRGPTDVDVAPVAAC